MTLVKYFISIFLLSLTITSGTARATDAITLSFADPAEHGNLMIAILNYQGMELLLSLPAIENLDHEDAAMLITLVPRSSNWESDVALSEKMTPIFHIDPEKLSSDHHLPPVERANSIAKLQLTIGSFTVPIEMIAWKDYAALGRGPAYAHYTLMTEGTENIRIPLSSEVLEQLKSASTGTLEVTDSVNAAINSNGAVTWDSQPIADYLAGHTRKQRAEQQATAEAAKAEQTEHASILAFRRNNLPAELDNVTLIEFDDSQIPEPQHRSINRICYKALYPYYRSQLMAEFNNVAPGHIGAAASKRCIDSVKVAEEGYQKCKKFRRPSEEACACARAKIQKFWEDHNQTEHLRTYESPNDPTVDMIRQCTLEHPNR